MCCIKYFYFIFKFCHVITLRVFLSKIYFSHPDSTSPLQDWMSYQSNLFPKKKYMLHTIIFCIVQSISTLFSDFFLQAPLGICISHHFSITYCFFHLLPFVFFIYLRFYFTFFLTLVLFWFSTFFIFILYWFQKPLA